MKNGAAAMRKFIDRLFFLLCDPRNLHALNSEVTNLVDISDAIKTTHSFVRKSLFL